MRSRYDPDDVKDLPLFAGKARETDPTTSKRAAASVRGGSLAARVLEELENGPGTTHELAGRLALSLVTVSPRMRPLEAMGLVVRAGERDGRTIWKRA